MFCQHYQLWAIYINLTSYARNSVSNYHQLDFLFNNLFRQQQRKHQVSTLLPFGGLSPQRAINAQGVSKHHHVRIHLILCILRLQFSPPYNNTSPWCKRGAKQIALSHWDSRQHNAEWWGELTRHPGPIVIPNKPLFDTLVPKLMNHQNLVDSGWCLEWILERKFSRQFQQEHHNDYIDSKYMRQLKWSFKLHPMKPMLTGLFIVL